MQNSMRTNKVITGAAAACLLAAFGVSLCVGRYPLGLSEILGALLGGESMAAQVFWRLRLPRSLAVMISGGALGVAGATYQALLGNPLAAPDVVGVSGGATLGAAVMIVCFGGAGLAAGAFAGGLCALAAALLVSPEDDALLTEMILLIGEAAGESERAQTLCGKLTAQLTLCAEMTAQAEKPTALVLGVGDSLHCAPGDMFQSTLLEKAGAVNAAAEMTGGSWAEISYEQLLAMNPQVLVIPAEAAYTAQDVLGDPELAGLDAVKNGRVCAMPTAFEAWDSPVPSGVLGALWLASELHPEAYAREQYVSAATELYETYYGFTPDEAAL